MSEVTKEAIRDALMELDPMDDGQWTKDGSPRVDIVAQLMEVDQVALKRADLVEAAPLFTRDNPVVENPDEADASEAAEEAAVETVSEEAAEEAVDEDMVDPQTHLAELQEELEIRKAAYDEAIHAAAEAQKPVLECQAAIDAVISQMEEVKRRIPAQAPFSRYHATQLKAYNAQAEAINNAPAPAVRRAPIDMSPRKPRPVMETPKG